MGKKEIMVQDYKILTQNYQIREETYQGRSYLVVPVVMMKEGVHNGSQGPILHQEEELRQFTVAWNGIPVTIHHPEEDGHNVSANSPRVMERYAVGQIFNTHYNDGLRAEAWIDLQKIEGIPDGPLALSYIRAGRPLDVSVGVFNESISNEGDWNGETYEAIARGYRPDHLALLPGEQGACSWADGCGIRANKKGGNVEDLKKSFKTLSEKGYAVSLISNEEGFQQISRLLQNSLDAMDTNTKAYYLEEVFANDFVYRVRTSDGGSTLYRRGYSMNNGTVEMADDSVEVRKQVEYVTMKMKRTKPSINSENKGGKMSKEQTLCCEAKVDALIANKLTHWQATDREWLLTQDEATIAKMSPIVPEKEEDTPAQVNKEKVIDNFKASLKTVEDFTAQMPEEMKATVEAGMKMYRDSRKAKIDAIVANSEFEEDELKVMSDAHLDKLSKSINKSKGDFSGQGEPVTNRGENGEEAEPPMVPVEYTWKKKKED